MILFPPERIISSPSGLLKKTEIKGSYLEHSEALEDSRNQDGKDKYRGNPFYHNSVKSLHLKRAVKLYLADDGVGLDYEADHKAGEHTYERQEYAV